MTIKRASIAFATVFSLSLGAMMGVAAFSGAGVEAARYDSGYGIDRIASR